MARLTLACAPAPTSLSRWSSPRAGVEGPAWAPRAATWSRVTASPGHLGLPSLAARSVGELGHARARYQHARRPDHVGRGPGHRDQASCLSRSRCPGAVGRAGRGGRGGSNWTAFYALVLRRGRAGPGARLLAALRLVERALGAVHDQARQRQGRGRRGRGRVADVQYAPSHLDHEVVHEPSRRERGPGPREPSYQQLEFSQRRARGMRRPPRRRSGAQPAPAPSSLIARLAPRPPLSAQARRTRSRR